MLLLQGREVDPQLPAWLDQVVPLADEHLLTIDNDRQFSQRTPHVRRACAISASLRAIVAGFTPAL